MSSILTNASALSALQSLTQTQNALQTTENQVSTGLAVSSAADNASYWSIATQPDFGQRRRYGGQPGAVAEPVGALDRLLGDQLDHHHDQLDQIGPDPGDQPGRQHRRHPDDADRPRPAASGRRQRRLVQRSQRPRRLADRGSRLRLRLQRFDDRRHDQHDRFHLERLDRRHERRRRHPRRRHRLGDRLRAPTS